jgi:hypothetical protein
VSNLPERPDPRQRPPDPAGTRPRVDPASLLPARSDAPPTIETEPIVDAEVVEDVPQEHDLLPERRAAAGGMVAAAPEVPHAPRFQFLLGALIAVGVVAIALSAALIVGRPSSSAGPSWSPWHPTTSSVSATQQIAGHVGPEYRLPSGQQLVAVTGGPLEVAGLPMTVVLRSDPTANGAISVVSGTGVLYRLCGLGAKCAIDQGQASTQRHLLLRREALELALYTFRYVDGVNQVVVFLPPKMGQDPSQALFFRAGDLVPELNRPLDATLAPRAPSVTGIKTAPDSSMVQRLTSAELYLFTLTQANQDASVFLVLRPPTVTGG